MKELKFKLEYDNSPYDCVEKISDQLNKIDLDIRVFSEEDGEIEFEIIKMN